MAKNRIKIIHDTLKELEGLFWELDYIGDWDHISGKHQDDLKERYIKACDSFNYYARRIFILCCAQLESEGLINLLSDFKKDIEPYLANKDNKLFESEFDEENALATSTFLGTIILYMEGTKSFSSVSENIMTHRVGLQYLENILKSTAIILKNLGKPPKKETDIYKEVKYVLHSVFIDYHKSTFAFTKPTKNYKPDILIPQLNTAIEYKYADKEEALSECIEEIRTDVYGYSDHPTFKLFYAVFYMKNNFCTNERANEIWSDHEFPKNWKPIFVSGA